MVAQLAMIKSLYHYFETLDLQRMLLIRHVMNWTMGIEVKMTIAINWMIVQFDFKLVGFHT